jgi:hypothetical protein
MKKGIETEARGAEPSGLRLLGPVLQIVHANLIAAVACVAALLAAFAFGLLLPLAIAALFTGVVVGARLASPKVWRAAADAEASKPVTMPNEADIADRGARSLLARILAARSQLDDVVGAVRSRRRDLVLRLRRVRDLERAAVAALLQLDYLASAPRAADGESATTRPELSGEKGAGAAPIMERAAAAQAERLEALRVLEAHRIEQLARLEYVTSCLEAVPAELMELQVLEADAVERGLPDPVREADLFRDEVRDVRRLSTVEGALSEDHPLPWRAGSREPPA